MEVEYKFFFKIFVELQGQDPKVNLWHQEQAAYFHLHAQHHPFELRIKFSLV
jgi:hypothetical protein